MLTELNAPTRVTVENVENFVEFWNVSYWPIRPLSSVVDWLLSSFVKCRPATLIHGDLKKKVYTKTFLAKFIFKF